MGVTRGVRLWCAAWAALLVFCWGLVAAGDAQTPVSVAACPPSSTSHASAPSSPTPTTGSLTPAAEQIVACVGAQSITGATFLHWADVARRSGGKHPPSAADVANEVMGFLISSDWVLGEAADLNIHVSEGEVRHTFTHIRNQQFPKHREFNAFLKRSGQTVADLLFRVRLNVTSERIQKRVVAGHRGARSRLNATKRFVREFKLKWTAQTSCEPGYAIPDCGHVQAGL
jgi:hypothetical protein